MAMQKIIIPEGAALDGQIKISFSLFPGWLQVTAREHAKSYGTPSELWLMAFLSGIAAASGKRAKLITGNYANYPQLWIMVVGASGTGKSDPFRVAFKSLEKINDQRYIDYQQRYRDWEANEKQGRPPHWEQILISDTTPEALFPAITHTNALTLYRDELSGWFADFGRYNKSGELAHYLSIYNNNQVIINRKTDKPQLINDPFLNIYGTIQPGILADVLSRNNAEESGFAQRFLYLYPDFSPKRYQPEVIPPSMETYAAVIGNIVGYTGQDEYFLSDKAEKEYESYFSDCEAMKYDGTGEFWAAVYSKAQIQVLRLALTVKIARLTDDSTNEVSGDDMQAAINIMDYCINSLRKFKEEQGGGRKRTSDVIRDIYKVKPDASPTIIGELFGVSKQYAHKLRMVDRLTVDNIENPLQEQEIEKTGVNQKKQGEMIREKTG